MASPSTVITEGYGSFGSVNLLPTLGYGIGSGAVVSGTGAATALRGVDTSRTALASADGSRAALNYRDTSRTDLTSRDSSRAQL